MFHFRKEEEILDSRQFNTSSSHQQYIIYSPTYLSNTSKINKFISISISILIFSFIFPLKRKNTINLTYNQRNHHHHLLLLSLRYVPVSSGEFRDLPSLADRTVVVCWFIETPSPCLSLIPIPLPMPPTPKISNKSAVKVSSLSNSIVQTRPYNSVASFIPSFTINHFSRLCLLFVV